MFSIKDKNARSYNRSAQAWADAIITQPAHKYLEKPAMEKELPKNLTGKSVLCIGVGLGHELDEVIARGANRIVGIDTAERLLHIASKKYPHVIFKKMDMMRMSFPDESFDLVYSSLTFHYAYDWDGLLAGVRRITRPGGTLLFSTHHPIYWSLKPKTGKVHTNSAGVTLAEHTATLPAGLIDITFYNHPNEQSIVDSIKRAGFQIQSAFSPAVARLSEKQYQGLSPERRATYDSLKEKNKQAALFFVIRATAV